MQYLFAEENMTKILNNFFQLKMCKINFLSTQCNCLQPMKLFEAKQHSIFLYCVICIVAGKCNNSIFCIYNQVLCTFCIYTQRKKILHTVQCAIISKVTMHI